ncbi:unnamed protein product [Adineta steineri]|uniref:Uncharacterized protein n=1 Tax=Adineta steineri TaxID=433720 RepID=A0A818V433_9BILA|nr:unnamed protein product [Adineta steineri]
MPITQFTFKRRLLARICIGVFILLFIFPSLYKEFYSYSSSSKFLSLQTKKIFEHVQPFYYPVSCQKLFESDSNEFKYVQTLLSTSKSPKNISDNQYNITKEQCDIYRSERFDQSFHHEDILVNRQFPLAFNILLHDNVQQFERLLRLIYRPQNFYCVHVDSSALWSVFESVKSIVQCFDNIYLVSKREEITYATFSRLQADINCMNDSIKYSSWKYLLNIASSELPLKTNSELVKILSIYQGHNDIEGIWKKRNMERTDYVWQTLNKTGDRYGFYLKNTGIKKQPPPDNLLIFKGSAYGAFSRAFVEFVLTNEVAKRLLEWSRDTYSPDEHYWATLNYNTHLNTPGGYKAKTDPTIWTSRYANWGESHCYGQIIRGICVFGFLDLPSLLNRHELIANKFYLHTDPIAYQCLEELIFNRSRLDLPLNDATFYRRMPFLLPS